MKTLTFEDIREQYNYDQVIQYFNIPISFDNKICCPFHEDDTPSHLINEKSGYCFGCGWSGSTFDFVQQFLKLSVKNTFYWFESHQLPTARKQSYSPTSYEGPVNPELVSYWHSLFDAYALFKEQRLFEPETTAWYQIGFRPDWNAYVIPFWRGLPGQSEIDIVQFRKLEGLPKYVGLKGHNRTSFMNAHVLKEEQAYVLVFFGSFDAILALQDGLCAVGMNGSNISKKDVERIQELFKKQSTIIIIPDNSPQEFTPAYALAEILGATVKFFPESCPEGTDYIDYRKSHSVLQFEYEVLSRLPSVNEQVLENCISLVQKGDPYNLLEHHVKGVPAFIAAHLSVACDLNLWDVCDLDSLVTKTHQIIQGGW